MSKEAIPSSLFATDKQDCHCLSTEDIRIGVSQPRNKKLAEVFHRLRLIEIIGRGAGKKYRLKEKR